MPVIEVIIGVVAYIFITLIAAGWLGWIAGIYRGSREASFRRRAVRLTRQNGRDEEFLILAGEPALVEELYRICVATTARAQEIADEKRNASGNEGIALNDEEQPNTENTDRSDRA